MINSKRVFVKVGTKSYRWYTERGYKFKCGDTIEVDVSDLTISSSAIIEVTCSRCSVIKLKKYYNYINVLSTSNDGRYYCSKCGYENKNETNINKYGSKSPLRHPENIEKSKNTLIKIYGVDNISKVDYIKEERSIQMSNRYPTMIDRLKEIYDVDNISKLEWVKEKKKITTMSNWGVENPSQNSDIFERSQISGKKIKLHKIGLYYRGTYERDFLDICLDNNINVEKGKTIEYRFDGKKKYYHSDFYLPEINLIVEIKSNYYMSKYIDKNNLKQEYTIKSGYNHIFIIDKNYTQFYRII